MSLPLIVGIGGSTRDGSSTELAVAYALRHAETLGARTLLVGGPHLASFAMYAPDAPRSEAELQFVQTIREADGFVVGTPGYHGSLSGLVKNALDLVEETSRDPRAYLTGRAVGCIVTAYGWQATGTTLVALRSVVHALRGWPTPMGAGLNMAEVGFDATGVPGEPRVAAQLELVAEQVVTFARSFRPGLAVAA